MPQDLAGMRRKHTPVLNAFPAVGREKLECGIRLQPVRENDETFVASIRLLQPRAFERPRQFPRGDIQPAVETGELRVGRPCPPGNLGE
jgi:hypothetical protein